MAGFINSLSLFLQIAVQIGTPILLAILGGILCEKVGNLNLGIEGMMIMGSSIGFAAAINTSNPFIALLAAAIAGSAGALIYAFITVTLRGNQVVTGLVLTIFGTGVSGFLGKSLSGKVIPDNIKKVFAPVEIPFLSKIPVFGKMFFSQSLYVLASIIVAILVYIYLNKTKIGLNTRAVGENPSAADASGINVNKYKYLNILTGGALCGLGGAYLSLVFITRWQDNVTSGAGWIAVSLVIFSTWNPLKAIFAAYAFGALRGISFAFQSTPLPFFKKDIFISSQLLNMLPYIATVVVLVVISIKKKKENQPPLSLGTPYFREER